MILRSLVRVGVCTAIVWLLSAGLVVQADELDGIRALEAKYRALLDAGRDAEAETYARATLLVVERDFPHEPGMIAAASVNIAIALERQAKYAEAEPLYRKALAIQERIDGPNHPNVADTLGNLAGIYLHRFQFDRCEQVCNRALKIRETQLGPNHLDLVYSLDMLSKLCDAQARFEEAIGHLKRAVRILDVNPKAPFLLRDGTMVHLANACNQVGRNAEAELIYKQSLKLEEQTLGPNHPHLRHSLASLGELCCKQRRFAEAETYLRRALKIGEQSYGRDHHKNSVLLMSLGSLFNDQNRNAEALEYYERALKIEEQQSEPDQLLVSDLVQNIALQFTNQGKWDDALRNYQRALTIYQKHLGNSHPKVASSLNNLGYLQEEMGNLEQAEKYYDRALKQLLDGNFNIPLQCKLHRSLSRIKQRQGRDDESLIDLQRVLKLADQMRATYSGGDEDRSRAYEVFKSDHERMIRLQSIRENFAESFAAAEHFRARSLTDQIALQGADLLARVPPEQAKQLRDRERAAQLAVATLEQELKSLVSQSKLSDAEKQAEEQRLTTALAAARGEVIEAYRAIRNASPGYRTVAGQDFKSVGVEQLQPWLQQRNALLLQYFFGVDGGYLFVIPPDGSPRIVRLNISKRIAKQLRCEEGPLTRERLDVVLHIGGKPVNEAIADQDEESNARLHDRLALLWELLVPARQREELVSGKYQRLIVVPDAGLENLPFDALVVKTNNGEPEYLLDVGPPIMTAPSATLLHNLSQAPPSSSLNKEQPVLSASNPIYPHSKEANVTRDNLAALSPAAQFAILRSELKSLSHTANETDWLAENLKPAGLITGKLKGANATELAVRTYAKDRQIVHFACHGITDQTHGNLFGALALTPGPTSKSNPQDDGFLTLAEIYELNLKGCELAILSACETNIGPQQQGEGVFALSRGFLVAGARRVIASNWIVDDESTANLVSVFGSLLAKQHKAEQPFDYAQALHDAKRWLRKQDKWKHPYYWGTFTLVGPN
jgi:CHAT domain-containing protein/Tfp pilus assembly protein PilF